MKPPCMYKNIGCQNRIPIGQEVDHQCVCKFRPYLCPVGACSDLIPRREIFRHCESQHPDNVVSNPYEFQPDITVDGTYAYIIVVFKTIFIIRTRVCLSSEKIFLSVKYIQGSKQTRAYQYQTDIKVNGQKLEKKQTTAPEGSEYFQNDTFTPIEINSSVITLKISGYREGQCTKCGNFDSKFVYREGIEWVCEVCAPRTLVCHNSVKGCTYRDTLMKSEKHLKLYCEFTTNCSLCKTDRHESWDDHYASHVLRGNSTTPGCCRVVVRRKPQFCVVASNVGMLVCCYYRTAAYFRVYISSPLESHQLFKYKCTLDAIDVDSGTKMRRTNPSLKYGEFFDWCSEIKIKPKFKTLIDKGYFNMHFTIKEKDEFFKD